MNIYLVRHGQSIGNLNKKFLGHTDLDLSEAGFKQASCVCDYIINNLKIDKIYSSDLIRAYNTVLPVAKALNMEIIKDKQLREIKAGLWENQEYEYLIKHFGDSYNRWLTDIGNAGCDGGETVQDLQCRFMTRLEEIAKENNDKNILIGTHATPIRIVQCTISGKPLSEMNNIPWALNASLTHIEYTNNQFRIIEYGKTSYLGDLVTQPSSKM